MLTRTYVYKTERNGFLSKEFHSIEACRLCAETACKTFFDVVTVFILDYDNNKVYRYKQYNPSQTEWEFERDFSDDSDNSDDVDDNNYSPQPDQPDVEPEENEEYEESDEEPSWTLEDCRERLIHAVSGFWKSI